MSNDCRYETMTSPTGRVVLAAAGLALVVGLSPTPARSAAQEARFDFRRDPAQQGFVVQGTDDGRFDFRRGRGLMVHLDSNLPGARLLAPLPFTLDGSTSFVATFDFEVQNIEASSSDFFQAAFGLVNTATTGLNRTGTSLPSFPFFVDDSDCWDDVEFDYYPNVTFFGGPFLQPTVFGGNVGSPFANFAANFGSSSDLGDNTGDELRELPVGVQLRAELAYDACRQTLVTRMLDVSRGRAVELATGLAPVDVSFVNATATFHVDAIAVNAYQDLADFDPSTRSLLADVEFRAATVERLGTISAVLLPHAINPDAPGEATVRVDGLVGVEPGVVPARLVEADGIAVDVALHAHGTGGGTVLVSMPRAFAQGPTVVEIAGCRIAVDGPPRLSGR